MSTLFILGNTNECTFANSIVAAQARAEHSGERLSFILVIHSPASETVLAASSGWKKHLIAEGLQLSVICPIMVDLEKGGPEEYRTLAKHLRRNLSGQDHGERIYVDLTNGTSLYKSTLSVVAFILGIRDQFVLDVTRLPKGAVFLSKAALADLYVQAPDPTVLDELAPVWHTEIRRYRLLIHRLGRQLSEMGGGRTAEVLTFEQEASTAIKNLFDGERNNKATDLAVATRGAGVAFEVFIRLLSEILELDSGPDKRLVKEIDRVTTALASYSEKSASLFLKLSTILREARNEATHPGGVLPFPFQRIKARMSFELLSLLVEHTSAVHLDGKLKPMNKAERIAPRACEMYRSIVEPKGVYYFGLDGDDTGRELERMFAASSEDEKFTQFSRHIEGAIKGVAQLVKAAQISGRVLFCAGDDVLFTGSYSQQVLNRMKSEYRDRSGGHTCSIGFGRTPREAYVALKLAKARPGKSAIIGIEVVQGNGPAGIVLTPPSLAPSLPGE